MLVRSVAVLVIWLALSSSALADAAEQGCLSSANNASGCLGAILAAPAPLAEGGLVVVAIGLAVFLKRRARKKK